MTVGPKRGSKIPNPLVGPRRVRAVRLSLRALAMTTLDMTGRLGSTLHGFELDKAYAGDTDEQGRRHGYGTYRFPNAFFTYRGDFECAARSTGEAAWRWRTGAGTRAISPRTR